MGEVGDVTGGSERREGGGRRQGAYSGPGPEAERKGRGLKAKASYAPLPLFLCPPPPQEDCRGGGFARTTLVGSTNCIEKSCCTAAPPLISPWTSARVTEAVTCSVGLGQERVRSGGRVVRAVLSQRP